MPTAQKSKAISPVFSQSQIDEALAAAAPPAQPTGIDWTHAIATHGGGVAETISQLRRARGKNKNPIKEQVAIRLDPEVLAAFRAEGPGWQTRMNSVLKEWLHAKQSAKMVAKRK